MDLGLGNLGIMIEELDGIPSGFCTKLKITNGGLTDNGDGSFTVDLAAGAVDHGSLTGLSDDDHAQYNLLAGRAGGQTLIGGIDASDGLILQSTNHATKGLISIGSALYVDEVNSRIGMGTNTPTGIFHAITTNAEEPFIFGGSFIGSFSGATIGTAKRIACNGHGLTPISGDLLVITSSTNGNEGIYYVDSYDASTITIDGSFLNAGDTDADFTIISGAVAIEKEDGSGNQYLVGGFLRYRSLFMEYGTNDLYSRPQLHLKTTNSVIRIGSFQGDGDGIGNNQAGAGLIIYGGDAQGDTFDADNYGYAFIKSDRLGLYNDKDGGYAGYLFRVDLSDNEFYIKDNSGNTTFTFDRSTGDLNITGNLDTKKISLKQTGTVQIFTYEATVNDDAYFDLPDAIAGMGMASFNEGAEYALFSFTDVGAVTLMNNSANVANSQSDGNYCIYDSGGTAVRIENKIGSNVNIKVFVWYN